MRYTSEPIRFRSMEYEIVEKCQENIILSTDHAFMQAVDPPHPRESNFNVFPSASSYCASQHACRTAVYATTTTTMASSQSIAIRPIRQFVDRNAFHDIWTRVFEAEPSVAWVGLCSFLFCLV